MNHGTLPLRRNSQIRFYHQRLAMIARKQPQPLTPAAWQALKTLSTARARISTKPRFANLDDLDFTTAIQTAQDFLGVTSTAVDQP